MEMEVNVITNLTISLATIDELETVAEFIENMNQREEHHIGYCGTDKQEIKDALIGDLSDVPFEASFLIATINKSIIGIIGFDADVENKSAEIWGPFIHRENAEYLPALWNKMLEILPLEITTLGLFPNQKNDLINEFTLRNPILKTSAQTILQVTQHLQQEEIWSFHELTPEYYDQMKKLHDQTFPDTYYNGAQIIERINPQRKVLIHTKEKKLIGYIYVEVEPNFGDANIEFFAVEPSERKKGMGAALLQMALGWIFTFKEIQDVTLCVESSNKKAISLYQKIGFKKKYQLNYFLINR